MPHGCWKLWTEAENRQCFDIESYWSADTCSLFFSTNPPNRKSQLALTRSECRSGLIEVFLFLDLNVNLL